MPQNKPRKCRRCGEYRQCTPDIRDGQPICGPCKQNDENIVKQLRTPEVSKRMVGKVVKHGHYFVVECPDAPVHLQILYLTARQVMGAKVGDTVTLEYQTTPSLGLWNVVKVGE